MKKALSILFLGIFTFSLITIQSASAGIRANHVRSNLNTVNPSVRNQIKSVANTQAQAAAAAKINYDEEYAKKFYTENNLKSNYYKK